MLSIVKFGQTPTQSNNPVTQLMQDRLATLEKQAFVVGEFEGDDGRGAGLAQSDIELKERSAGIDAEISELRKELAQRGALHKPEAVGKNLDLTA